ncbi:hypothetical protein PACTADRAFT_15477 [Pachysolen tannophilus NRRL Y-2460]|uniref:26S proteasome complex subunit SEM1 n=1 Tax=Pachysolen tannophilus NRRL Y-2460 TaxID=669874 RepID=A0A1E4TZ12_PACTA|nr:hypothetical protein PACTADRAFT_15477 [Pachysolen tannophilus NRRL Y-2460]
MSSNEDQSQQIQAQQQQQPSDAAKTDDTKVFKTLEEDDEFEDFPAEDWKDDQTIGAEKRDHLWDESWDDNDNDDDFTQRLKDELKKHAK